MASWSCSSQQVDHQTNSNPSSSGSEVDPEQIRKRNRMLSNRESARRSRLRKQKHLDDLAVQVKELKAQNNKILSTTNATTQLYLDVEAQNSVLRAQLGELTNRLYSINDIITASCLNNNIIIDCPSNIVTDDQVCFDLDFDHDFSWGFSFANSDVFMC